MRYLLSYMKARIMKIRIFLSLKVLMWQPPRRLISNIIIKSKTKAFTKETIMKKSILHRERSRLATLEENLRVTLAFVCDRWFTFTMCFVPIMNSGDVSHRYLKAFVQVPMHLLLSSEDCEGP